MPPGTPSRTPSGRPALAGAEIVDVALDGRNLVLWIENQRHGGQVHAGTVTLRGVLDASSRDERYADDAVPLQAGLTIQKASWGVDRLHLWCLRETGPGDADTPHFEIRFTTLEQDLRSSVTKSLRALAGLYPGRADRRRRLPGPGRVEIAQLRPGGLRVP